MGNGVLTGYTTKDVRRDCGYQGMPIIFKNINDYNNFLREKLSAKKFNEYKQEEKKEKTIKIKRPPGITILVLIIIFLAIISVILYYELLWVKLTNLLWIYYISIFVLSAIILPYGFLKARAWSWTIGAILFALCIPIGLVFLYYITRPNVKNYFGKKDIK